MDIWYKFEYTVFSAFLLLDEYASSHQIKNNNETKSILKCLTWCHSFMGESSEDLTQSGSKQRIHMKRTKLKLSNPVFILCLLSNVNASEHASRSKSEEF